MDCPTCGIKLPPLTAVLAQTIVGAQCPNCWTRLRRLALRPVVVSKKELERRVQPSRRAA